MRQVMENTYLEKGLIYGLEDAHRNELETIAQGIMQLHHRCQTYQAGQAHDEIFQFITWMQELNVRIIREAKEKGMKHIHAWYNSSEA